MAAAVDRTPEAKDAAMPRMALCSGESVKSTMVDTYSVRCYLHQQGHMLAFVAWSCSGGDYLPAFEFVTSALRFRIRGCDLRILILLHMSSGAGNMESFVHTLPQSRTSLVCGRTRQHQSRTGTIMRKDTSKIPGSKLTAFE